MEKGLSTFLHAKKIDRRTMIKGSALSMFALFIAACDTSRIATTEIQTDEEEATILYDYGTVTSKILQEDIMPQIGLTGAPTDQGKWFGLENIQMRHNQGDDRFILRIRYPKGSASQTVTNEFGAPVGGAQFNVALPQVWKGKERLNLSYSLRFDTKFQFMQGGKLPGFYGGETYSGQRPPDGSNGFSTRYMWNRNGRGSAYVYSPEIEGHDYDHGIHYGLGNWKFVPGEWIDMRQQIRLNTPGTDDGRIQIWHNGESVLNQHGMRYRDTDELGFDGVYFSTFFGGSDPSWETPQDTYIDFANFQVDDAFRENNN